MGLRGCGSAFAKGGSEVCGSEVKEVVKLK